MQKTHDLAVKTGTYQKDGQEKGRYINIGSVMKNENGAFLILNRTFNPAGVPNPENREGVMVSLFPVKDNNQHPQQQAPQQQRQSSDQGFNNNFDSDIPF